MSAPKASVELVSLILAVLAMAVALWHLLEIRSTAKRLDEVRRSLSTRYIGQFPEYVPEIVSLLRRAKRQIVIFCDFPSYASYTDPDTWLDYKQTLERKIQQEEVKVAITFLNQSRRSRAVQEQFFDGCQDWNGWKSEPTNIKRLQRFLSTRSQAPSIARLTKEDFMSLVEEFDQRTLRETFAGAELWQIDSYIPLFFWLVDGMTAVFAIPGSVERAVEYGFSTTDQKLISAFVDMRQHYHREIAPTVGVAEHKPESDGLRPPS